MGVDNSSVNMSSTGDVNTSKIDSVTSSDIVLTGDRPSGCLHLGHYVGSLYNRVLLQDKCKCYLLIADVQALSANFDHPEQVKKNIIEVCKDYLAVGINPEKTTIFVQSMIPELTELTTYYMNLISVARLERNPTVKAELQTKSFASSITSGFLNHPVSQMADITTFKATAIPVGEDQLPILEVSNEIVRRFNNTYKKNVLKECRGILSNTTRLVGIDGKAKASKSLGNAIILCDEPKVLKEKVFSMYTDPNHINVSDPGRVEGNVVFSYLDAFWDNQKELDDLKAQYRKGGLGDVVLKNMLHKRLEEIVAPIREKRASISESDVYAVLNEGTKQARIIAIETLYQVKEAIGLVYPWGY